MGKTPIKSLTRCGGCSHTYQVHVTKQDSYGGCVVFNCPCDGFRVPADPRKAPGSTPDATDTARDDSQVSVDQEQDQAGKQAYKASKGHGPSGGLGQRRRKEDALPPGYTYPGTVWYGCVLCGCLVMKGFTATHYMQMHGGSTERTNLTAMDTMASKAPEAKAVTNAEDGSA